MKDNTGQTIQGFRLSPQQRRVWQLQQRGAILTAQGVIEIIGEICEATLRAALQRIAERHDILRASFHDLPGMNAPVMAIAERPMLEWERCEGAQVSLPARLLSARRRRFAPATDAVLRASFSKPATDKAALIVTLPALCADAASLRNLTAELAAAYAATRHNTELTAPELSYTQYAEWQNQLPESEAAAEALAYWQAQQLSALAELRLPLETTTDAVENFAPVSHVAWVEAELSAQLRAVAARLGVSSSLTLQAVWRTLLARLTGEQEFAVGVVCDGREFDVLQTGVGLFARAVPARCSWPLGQTFNRALARLAEAMQGAREWQDYFRSEDQPEGVRECLSAQFEFIEADGAHLAEGVSFRLAEQLVYDDYFYLKLVCRADGDALRLEFQFDPRRFAPPMIEQLSQQFLTALADVCAQPERPLERIQILPQAERQSLLSLAAAETRAVEPLLFHQLVEARAARVPARAAVICEAQSLTCAELNARANQLGRFLRGLGVGPEVTVGLCLERSPELMVGVLGVLKAGGAYAPLDPAQPKQRAAQMLEDLRATVLLTQERLLERLPEFAGRVVCLDRDWPQVALESAANVTGGARPENLAYVLFTSGSTGRPKGVAVEHRQLLNYLHGISARLRLPEGASYATVSTFAADLGNTAIFPALAGGGTLHIVTQARATDPEAFAEYFEQHEIDCLKIVPSHLAALLEAPRPERALPQHRLVIGGEAAPAALLARVRQLQPQCEIINHYGPTETTVGVLTHSISRSDGARSLPLGRPLPNVRAYVLETNGQPAPFGVWGELYLGGAQVTRGYLHRPDLTAERFVPDPFSATGGARLYRSGDRARMLPDGNVEFAGRLDKQIKFHGYRIELDEIRSALNRHPQVRDSVAVIARDANGQDVIVAYYVARQELETADLRAFLAEHLLEVAVPNVFAYLKRLPLTLNGKLSYDALPALEEIRKNAKQQFVAPRTPEEAATAAIWAEVLALKRVSIEENFFELGGHSLLATQVISRMRAAFGVEVQLRSLFATPTVAGLAAGVTSQLAARQSAAETVAPLVRAEQQGLAEQLAALDQLTEEEAQALIATVR